MRLSLPTIKPFSGRGRERLEVYRQNFVTARRLNFSSEQTPLTSSPLIPNAEPWVRRSVFARGYNRLTAYESLTHSNSNVVEHSK